MRSRTPSGRSGPCLFARLHLIAAVALAPTAVFAQPAPYPAKAVRVLVGLTPGGATDLQARWFSQKLSASTGRQFVVDNRPAAGGLLAYQLAVAAPADGYTLLAVAPGHTIAPALGQKSLDPTTDLAPISLLTKSPFLVVVLPAFPAKSIQDLIAYARAKPDDLIFGVSGRTAIHLGVVWLAQATRTRMTIVTYKGNGPAQTDLLAGQVHAALANMLSAASLIRSGRLRGLAVTSLERMSTLPDMPTVAESGVPGYDVTTWHGWAAPRGTSAAITGRLREELVRAVNAPDLTERLAEEGSVRIAGTPEEFGRYLAAETVRWRKLVREAGLKVE